MVDRAADTPRKQAEPDLASDDDMLSMEDAALLLGVSRVEAVRLLDKKRTAASHGGAEATVRRGDVLRLKATLRRKTLDELSALDRELGLT